MAVHAHEKPLANTFHRRLGGSAGKHTHGGDYARPAGMPTRKQCDYEPTTPGKLLDVIDVDGAKIYIDRTLDLTGEDDITIGDGTTLVGGFCDPSIPGRGPVLKTDHYCRRLFKTRDPVHMYGISLRGPNVNYFDPRERAKSNDWDTDDPDDWLSAGVFTYPTKKEDASTFIGCEFFGWTVAGVEVGSKENETSAIFRRCSGHNCPMETYGYAIEHYNGEMIIEDCFFDVCRHAVSSFGYPTAGYTIRNSVLGPGPWYGHGIDVHALKENIDTDSDVAGWYMHAINNTIMSWWDGGGFPQEGIAVRNIPRKKSRIEKNHFPLHKRLPDPTGGNGDAYRQGISGKKWKNVAPKDNLVGKEHKAGYGAPRAPAATTLTKPVQHLRVQGHSIPGWYELHVRGRVKSGRGIEQNDTIRNADGGKDTVIRGRIVGAADDYLLDRDAQLTSAHFEAPCTVTIDNEPVEELPSLVSVGSKQH